MSTDTESVDLSWGQIREAYNPFKHGCWLEFANKVTEGYMDGEPDPWRPLGAHHERWIRDLRADKDLVLMCHRDGLKTTIVTIYLLAHLEYKDGFRAYWITNTQDQAFEKADQEFEKYVDRNPWLTELNKPRKNDSKKSKEFANGAQLTAGWLFGAIEGGRSHLLILDDIIKERGDGDTEDILTWIQGVTVPMVKDGGKTAIIGTRKSPDDIYAHFADQPGYQLTEYPAILDEWDRNFSGDDNWGERRPDESLYTEVENPWNDGTMHVLWPDARGPEWLADKKQKMSPHLFWREYCLVIRGGSGNLVSEGDINQLAENGGCSIRGQNPPRQYTAEHGEFVVVGHDPAQSKTGDNAAFVTMLVRSDGVREILDAHAQKGMRPSQIKDKLASLDARYDPAMIVIEDNGFQGYLVNDAIEMGSEMRAKVRGMTTTGKKHSWENGIPRLQTLIENGSIQFYRGDDGTEQFIHAALSLELKDGNMKGHTPDNISAWYMADRGARAISQHQNDDASSDAGSNVNVSGY